MAITEVKINNAAVADDYAGYAPIVVSGETDRWPFDDGVRQVDPEKIMALASESGKLAIKFTDAFAAFWLDADIIQLSGLTGDAAVFNGRHNIDDASGDPDADILILETVYTGSLVGSQDGTATRMNDSLMVEIVINDDTPKELGTVMAKVGEGGVFEADISGIVQLGFSSIFDLTPGEIDSSGFSVDIDLEFNEVYQKSDWQLVTNDETPATPPAFIAHKTTDLTDQINGTGMRNAQWQTRLRGGGVILHHIMTTNANRIIFNPDNDDATIINVSSDNKHIAVAFTVPDGAKFVTVRSVDKEITPNVDEKDVLTYIINRVETGKRLYWLNQLGGYSCMEVHKWEDRKVADKADRYTTDSYKVRDLYGIEEPETLGEYLQDLIDSPEIRDENGNQVYITTARLQYRGERVEPVITIKTESEWIN